MYVENLKNQIAYSFATERQELPLLVISLIDLISLTVYSKEVATSLQMVLYFQRRFDRWGTCHVSACLLS